MDSEVRTAQLILKGTLHEMSLEDQIRIEDALRSLREVGFAFPDVIEFATSMYAMELAQLADVKEEPATEERHWLDPMYKDA